MIKCKCGCEADTNSGWIFGHWNRGKKHVGRRKRGTRTAALLEESEKRKQEAKIRKEEKKAFALKQCACGCGTLVKGKWAWGHHSRVNNISKRKDIKEKRRIAMKLLHENGEMPDPWNKGKTKETDERLIKQGESWKNNTLTDEYRKTVSDRFKKLWKEGAVVPFSGSNHPMWKGGESRLARMIRGSYDLHKLWKLPILSKCEFKCIKCSSTKDLNVHHWEIRMNEIYTMFIGGLKEPLEFELKKEIVKKIADYHIANDVPGVVLCIDCHRLVHEEERKSGTRLPPEAIKSLFSQN